MTLRVEHTQMSGTQKTLVERPQEQTQEQTFNYAPTEEDKNKGLQIEKAPDDPPKDEKSDAPRMSGVLQRSANGGTVLDKAMSVDGAACDAVLAPIETAIDIISGANNKDNEDLSTPRTTGMMSRMFKNGNVIVRAGAAFVDVVLSPVTSIIDAVSGANKQTKD